jgi:hypothetical protein
VCTKERHRQVAESKGFTVKGNDNNGAKKHTIRPTCWGCGQLDENVKAVSFTKTKAKIKPISKDKATELRILAEIKKFKIRMQGENCEICGKPSKVDLFHIITVGDKKHATNPVNLLLSCRFCHLVWGAMDYEKILKFINYEDILNRLKSLDEGKYWKFIHKVERYLNAKTNNSTDRT